MKAVIRCVGCELDLMTLERASFHELAYSLQGLIIASHATDPHRACELEFRIDAFGGAGDELRVECLHPRCQMIETPMVTSCPAELVGAIVIIFHTAHEGHRLRMSYGGQTWESPMPQQQERKAS